MPPIDLQPDEAGAKPTTPQPGKERRALSLLKRELTEEDLGTPGTRKMLLDNLDNLTAENQALQSSRDQFHPCDKALAVAKEKLKSNVAVDIVSTGAIAVGAAAMVYAPV